jgi:hypothetical protein
VKGQVRSNRYTEMLRFQDCIYPQNYIKLRCVENHDRKRLFSLAPTREQAIAWTAFQAFNKGASLIYAGQESAEVHTPSLFEIDKIEWGDYKIQELLTKIIALKKDQSQVEGNFRLYNSSSGIQAAWIHPEGSYYGVFNTDGESGGVDVNLDDGNYNDCISGKSIKIKKRIIVLPESFVILRISAPIKYNPFKSVLLDVN